MGNDFPIALVPALESNYIFIIRWNGGLAVVDPGEARPVFTFLEKESVPLSAILNTHHHSDHVGGNLDLQAQFSCPIIGPNDPRIRGLTKPVKENETIELGPYNFQVIEVPGHTRSHIAYYEPSQKWLFCGDTLFGGGCGRLFEGSPEEMFASLQKLMKLPPETLIFCGHEYAVINLKFALSIEPNNPDILNRLKEAEIKVEKHQSTVPSTLEIELKTNPFLRAHDLALRQSLGMENETDLEVFTHVRKMRNSY